MPFTYSPTAKLIAENLAIPDGDPSMVQFSRLLSDTRAYTRAASAAQLVWDGTFHAYGTDAAPRVDIGDIEVATLQGTADGWRAYSHPGGVLLTEADVTTPVGGPLTANTWYYVYKWANSPSLGAFYEITNVATTVVGTTRRAWKNGQTVNYRYLGCFRTDNNGNPIPVRAHNGTYVYDRSAANPLVSFFPVNGGAAPGVWTLVSLNYGGLPLIPPYAFQASLYIEVKDAIGAHILIRSSAADAFSWSFPILDTGHQTVVVDQTVGSAKTIQYMDGGGASVADDVYIGVMGWRE